jgi:hypothetical protein
MAQALANLGRLEKPTWVEQDAGFHRLVSPMSYGESMLQLESVVAALPFAQHAVFLPCSRGILLAADARSEAAVIALLREGLRCLQEEPWPMSSTVCRRGPDGWEAVEPALGARPLAHMLELQVMSLNYSAQKEALEAWHEAAGEDAYVAEFTVLGNDDEWTSYCVWTQGVKTLLPVTDWVALVPSDEDAEFLRVPWDQVVAKCASLLRATPESPARYLVDSFPTPGEWEALRQVALA